MLQHERRDEDDCDGKGGSIWKPFHVSYLGEVLAELDLLLLPACRACGDFP
jgi:hypothetical protein